jgi:hypothetical protein
MPDLDELAGFDPGLGAPLLPASEIRRRGDRLRRRRTGLVAGGAAFMVALAVGTPVLAMHGAHGDDVQPAPRPAPAPAPGRPVDWLTTVPPAFPLADGFPTPSGSPPKPDPELIPTCRPWELQSEDARVVSYAGESEGQAQRELVLFADAQQASAQMHALRDATTDCRATASGGTPLVFAPVPIDQVEGQADQSYAYAQQSDMGDALMSDLTLVVVTRTGNALYVDSSYGSAGGEAVIADELQRLQEASRVPLQAMCMFSATTCGSSLDIPGDLALGTGFVTGAGESVAGPSPTINGVSFSDTCLSEVWPGEGATDRLAVRLTAADHALVRELTSYASAEAAAETVASIAEICRGTGIVPLDADTGYPDSDTFGVREGDAGRLFQVVRIGRTVLATESSGTLVSGSLEGDVAVFTDDNRAVLAVVDRACGDAGC